MPDEKPSSPEIFNYSDDDEQQPQPEEVAVLEPEQPSTPQPPPARGKRKVKRGASKVKDIFEDDGTFSFEDAADPNDSLEDHFKKLDGLFRNLQAAYAMENWKIHLHRLEPKEIEGIKADGFCEPVPWPITAPQLYEMVAKKYGGGKYKALFWDDKGNVQGDIFLNLPGIPKLVIDKPKEGQPDLSAMTPRERELYAVLNAKEKDEAAAKIRAEYEAKSAKDKQQSSNELFGVLKTLLVTQKSGSGVSDEVREILRRQEDLITDLRQRLETKNNENGMASVLKAMVEMNKQPPQSQGFNSSTLELVKIFAPLLLGMLKPKDITENPVFSTLLTKIVDQKAAPADEMMKKVMDMNLDFTKKVAEMRIEKIIDDEDGGGDDGNITPKDILNTVSSAVETMMNRFGRAPQPGQPGIPQQPGSRQLPPGTTSPPRLITEKEEEEGDEEEPAEGEEKIQMIKINDQTRELLKGSIKTGNSGANFGKILLQQLPLTQFKEIIKSTDVPGLVKVIEPFLSEAVGDEIKGLLLKTDNGKKYMKEAIEFVKASI